VNQVLARPPGTGPPPRDREPRPDEIQFFLNDVEAGVWFCRRDNRVTRPASEVSISSPSGIAVIAPEIQLLYKARHHLDKDEHDFRLTVGRLSPERRTWLRGALEIIHPGDPLARPNRVKPLPAFAFTRARWSLSTVRPASSPRRA
jgi:hypothetical protein